MAVQREWATPVAAGAFLLSAVTGVVIFCLADLTGPDMRKQVQVMSTLFAAAK